MPNVSELLRRDIFMDEVRDPHVRKCPTCKKQVPCLWFKKRTRWICPHCLMRYTMGVSNACILCNDNVMQDSKGRPGLFCCACNEMFRRVEEMYKNQVDDLWYDQPEVDGEKPNYGAIRTFGGD